ncbi:MAG: hypothetical protein HGA62_07505 [Chlorobiaceae bacterium]|nr:hypothetical protein [Chlorobiaceae bacterium]NTV60375.1 hypothetical protein [Chlorobiaceae bacterium]
MTGVDYDIKTVACLCGKFFESTDTGCAQTGLRYDKHMCQNMITIINKRQGNIQKLFIDILCGTGKTIFIPYSDNTNR